MKYRVEIDQTIDRYRVFEVEADSEDDAIEKCWIGHEDANLIRDVEKDLASSDRCKEIPMNPTPTTIVEIMIPQPYEVLSDGTVLKHDALMNIVEAHPPLGYPGGDPIERDGKRWEVVSVGCKQVKDDPFLVCESLGMQYCKLNVSIHDWVWVYEVKGVGDE